MRPQSWLWTVAAPLAIVALLLAQPALDAIIKGKRRPVRAYVLRGPADGEERQSRP